VLKHTTIVIYYRLFEVCTIKTSYCCNLPFDVYYESTYSCNLPFGILSLTLWYNCYLPEAILVCTIKHRTAVIYHLPFTAKALGSVVNYSIGGSGPNHNR